MTFRPASASFRLSTCSHVATVCSSSAFDTRLEPQPFDLIALHGVGDNSLLGPGEFRSAAALWSGCQRDETLFHKELILVVALGLELLRT